MVTISFAASGSERLKSTELDGVVTDLNDTRVLMAEVEAVDTKYKKFVTETDSEGTFAFLVPPGVYRIRAAREGYCESRRAPVAVTGQKSLKFSFQLIGCPTVDYKPSDDDLTNYTPRPEPSPRYHYDDVRPVTSDGLWPVVSYGKREPEGTSIRYSSLVVGTRKFPVIYTFNMLTVKADDMVYSTLDSSIHATGHVVWETDRTSQSGSAIRISFQGDKPKVNLEE